MEARSSKAIGGGGGDAAAAAAALAASGAASQASAAVPRALTGLGASSSGRGLHSLCAPGAFCEQPNALQRRQQQPFTQPYQQQQHDGEEQQQQQWPPLGGSFIGGGDAGAGADAALPPALCGHPKNRITRHRAGNRRRRYYVEPWGSLAACPHCGAVGAPHQHLYRSGECSGRCLDGAFGQRAYPKEYKPPC